MNIWYEYGSRLNCLEMNYDFDMQGSKHINIESTQKVKQLESENLYGQVLLQKP